MKEKLRFLGLVFAGRGGLCVISGEEGRYGIYFILKVT